MSINFNRIATAKLALVLGLVLNGCGAPDAGSARRESYEIAFRDCAGCPEMVIVPKGDFTMGSPVAETGRDPSSEGAQRRVRIDRAFAVGRYEIMADQFRRFVQETGYTAERSCLGRKALAGGVDQIFSDWGWDHPDVAPTGSVPVACVSWDDAQSYVAWLSRMTGLRYRLLTEAEWEYAARAGTTERQYWATGSDACSFENSGGSNRPAAVTGAPAPVCRDRFDAVAPAGSFLANPFGLHDMLGNVSEWVQDCWQPGYTGAASDGSATESGECRERVRRGAAWHNGPQEMRSAARFHMAPRYRWSTVGFRVARDL